ncbi:MAG: hypothetical protein E7397_08040 [Ruminococcaceae bacterium]|nr:hypothetical protein [Oscillospiraceae bacterium]
MDISDIDKNFRTYYSFEGMKTYSVNQEPFRLYGLCRKSDEQDFKRLPHNLAKTVNNPSIQALYQNTSGIRVRFRTDSSRIVLKCVLPQIHSSPCIPQTGSSCFDLYADGHYCSVFRPGIDLNGGYSDGQMGKDGFSSGYSFKEKKEREILIHFPLYNDVSEVYIALEKDATLLEAKEYKTTSPIVFYGSSITQGGCASHPGNCYPAILSRTLDFDYINLGFSAGCLAEPEMADYISGLEKSVLVYDYDHNASTLSYLEQTHEPFFQAVRAKNPHLPIIIVSAADLSFGYEMRKKRMKVIKNTFEHAKSNGDKNVYFVDGTKIYETVGIDFCTVDHTHPNDLGFYCMAQAIGPMIEKIWKKENLLCTK